jgi:hypothetical protein
MAATYFSQSGPLLNRAWPPSLPLLAPLPISPTSRQTTRPAEAAAEAAGGEDYFENGDGS